MFDYRVITLDGNAEARLHELGAEGWRLIHVIPAYSATEPRGVLERVGPPAADD